MRVTIKTAAVCSAACLALAGAAWAADVASMEQTLAERIEVSMQVYRDQSAAIADEKIPLLREIDALEETNIDLREKIAAALRFTGENSKSFDSLTNRLIELRSQTEFAERFLREYLDAFESRINVAEDQHYKEALTTIRLALDAAPALPAERLEHELVALEMGMQRVEDVIGGYKFAGQAIASDGVLQDGTTALMGPAAYFSSSDETMTGLLQFHTGTIEPAVVSLREPHAGNLSRFIATGQGTPPWDASLGSALAVESANVKIVDHIARGGPVGYAILALGAAALIVCLIKLYDLSRFQSVDSQILSSVVRDARQKNEAGSLAKIKAISGPIGEMLELGVRNIRANGVLLEEMMLSVILRRRPEVERFLSFLAITAAAAPLLGLLGTVVGMIRTFALITVFGTDPRALSAGISEALVTTELGLMIAIPTLVLHGIFTRIIKSRFGSMERVAFEFVKTISLEESKEATG